MKRCLFNNLRSLSIHGTACGVLLLLLNSISLTHAQTTNAISAGQTITNAAISVVGETNYYTFSGISNETVTILMAKTGGTGDYPYFELYAPDGSTVYVASYDSIHAFVSAYPLTQSGDYQIRCRDDDNAETFTYNLTLIKSPGPNAADEEASEILPGQTLTNRAIGVGADIDVYTFLGTSNDTVTILMAQTAATGKYPHFELRAPDGSFIAGSVDHDDYSVLDAYRLTQTGTNQILCQAYNGTNTFTYNLTLIKNPGSNAADEDASAIFPGQTLTNRAIDVPSDMDVYSFSGTSNNTATILMAKTGGSGGEPYLELYAPDGSTVAAHAVTYLDNAYVSAYQLTQSGTNQILCRDANGTGTFTYNLTLIKSPGPNEGASAISPGQTLTNCAIDVAADMNVYTFTGASNDTVTILMAKTDGGGGDPYFELYAPDGSAVVARAITYLDHAYASAYQLAQSGTNQILCRDGNGTNAFSYNLTLIKNPGPNAADPGDTGPSIQPGQVITNSIGFPGDIDAVSFYAIAGDTVTISLDTIGGTGNYPYLEVQGPDGTVLTYVSGAPSLVVPLSCLSLTGDYMVICRDEGGDATFDYTLSLTQYPIELPSGGATQYLTIYKCSDQNVHLRWNTNATGFTLQSTTNLSSPTWTAVTNSPYVIGDHFYLDYAVPTNGTEFLRLIYAGEDGGL